MVISNHGESSVRINLTFELMSISLGSDRLGSVSLFFKKRKKKDVKRKKKIVLVPTYRDVGCCSLGACSQPACSV
jgi:hypothetical protein